MSEPQRNQLWQEDALGRHTPAMPFWAHYSRPLWIRFPVANVSTDMRHTLDTAPVGYLVIWSDANVHAVPGRIWTDQIAYLRADAANARALVIFFTTREDPEYVVR